MFDIRKMQEQVIYKAVKAVSNEGTAAQIVYGEGRNAAAEGDGEWVKSTMGRLEREFDKTSLKKIRMACQCGFGIDEKLALVTDIMKETSSLEEFGEHGRAKAAGLSFTEGALHLQFPFCPCPMLAEVDRLDTDTWCQCTTGYSKVLFEKAFGCDVDVELLKSVKRGDEICLMKIIPHGQIWR